MLKILLKNIKFNITTIFILLALLLVVSCSGENNSRNSNIRRYGNEKTKSSTNNKSINKESNYSGHYKVGNPYKVLGQTFYPEEVSKYKKTGIASWYGADFHDRKTANGETYNMHEFTAAHPTLQMPCIVRVTNLENGRTVKVKVNDRGPFAKDRIIDLSKATAKKLGFFEKGTAKVQVEYLKKDSEKLLEEYGLR